jgi:uncharacterized protein
MKLAGRVLCDIYRTSKRQEMYLYVAREDGLKRVPESLLLQFSEPSLVTTLVLSESRKLGRADVLQVMSDIADKGFYLQMPPAPYPPAQTELD